MLKPLMKQIKYLIILQKKKSTWVQLLCLTTFNIIKQELSFDINKPLFEGYYSDDDCN